MKKIIYLIITVFLMFSCGNNTEIKIEKDTISSEKVKDSNIKRVVVSEFEEAINSSEYILIDLRTDGELKQSGVLSEKVINIDFYASDFQVELSKLDKNKKYLIYCRSGNRSFTTLGLMKEIGFKDVLELKGGIGAWVSASKKFIPYGK